MGRVRVISHPGSHYTVSVVKLEVAVWRRIGKVPSVDVHVDEGTGRTPDTDLRLGESGWMVNARTVISADTARRL